MPTWMPMALRFGTCTGKCRVGRDEIAGFGVRWRWGRGCGGRAGGRAHATARRAAGAVRCEATTAAVAGAVRCVPCAAARAGGRGKVPTMPEPRGLKSRPLHSLWAGPSWPIHGFPPPTDQGGAPGRYLLVQYGKRGCGSAAAAQRVARPLRRGLGCLMQGRRGRYQSHSETGGRCNAWPPTGVPTVWVQPVCPHGRPGGLVGRSAGGAGRVSPVWAAGARCANHAGRGGRKSMSTHADERRTMEASSHADQILRKISAAEGSRGLVVWLANQPWVMRMGRPLEVSDWEGSLR